MRLGCEPPSEALRASGSAEASQVSKWGRAALDMYNEKKKVRSARGGETGQNKECNQELLKGTSRLCWEEIHLTHTHTQRETEENIYIHYNVHVGNTIMLC